MTIKHMKLFKLLYVFSEGSKDVDGLRIRLNLRDSLESPKNHQWILSERNLVGKGFRSRIKTKICKTRLENEIFLRQFSLTSYIIEFSFVFEFDIMG